MKRDEKRYIKGNDKSEVLFFSLEEQWVRRKGMVGGGEEARDRNLRASATTGAMKRKINADFFIIPFLIRVLLMTEA